MSWSISDLSELVDFLGKKADVYAPVGDTKTAFERLDGREPNVARLSDVSARSVFQPLTHYYLRFEDRPDADATFTDYDASPRVVLGMRPCDVAALDVQDRVFAESESHRALRDATTVVGLLCDRREDTCFCDSLGHGPHETGGMDVVVYPVPQGGYVVRAETDKGKELLAGAPFTEVSDPPEPTFEEREHPALETAGLAKSLKSLPKSDDPDAEGPDVWDDIAFACVNCRVCTYACPTCHCFTVTDEVFGTAGGRATVWDSCQNELFTKEASGHNPRQSKGARARQRILHKYLYYPAVHGEIMCTGCGRCIRGCPTGRNIVEELTALKGVTSP